MKICDMEVHIGKEIRKKWVTSGIKITELSKNLNTTPRNVYSIFNRKSINADVLLGFSKELDFDFFKFYQFQPLFNGMVQEPESNYLKLQKSNHISMIIVLDGLDATAEKWILKIRQINSIL